MCVSTKRDDILCFYHFPEFYRSTSTSYTITLSTCIEYINMYNVYIYRYDILYYIDVYKYILRADEYYIMFYSRSNLTKIINLKS